MSRLSKMVGANAAFVTALLLFNVSLVTESLPMWVTAAVGVWVCVGIAVQLIVSATRPERVSPPVMFDASPPLTRKQEARFLTQLERDARRGGVR